MTDRRAAFLALADSIPAPATSFLAGAAPVAPAPLDAAVRDLTDALARLRHEAPIGLTVRIDSLLAALSADKRLEEAGRERVPVNVSRWDDDTETMSFDGTTFTTVRPCRDCGVLICGGPTRCLYCAAKEGRP